MKFLKYTLSDWQKIHCSTSNYYNLYRRDVDHRLYVGFNIISADVPLEKRAWASELIGLEIGPVRDLFYSTFDKKKRYVHDELAQGIKDIDSFIIRINKLKSFM